MNVVSPVMVTPSATLSQISPALPKMALISETAMSSAMRDDGNVNAAICSAVSAEVNTATAEIFIPVCALTRVDPSRSMPPKTSPTGDIQVPYFMPVLDAFRLPLR